MFSLEYGSFRNRGNIFFPFHKICLYSYTKIVVLEFQCTLSAEY